ncbi:MAG: hypothetical protein PHG28_02940 [Rhodoferax sp.]|nr:hypothetical protein [Rhodoferax sp.]
MAKNELAKRFVKDKAHRALVMVGSCCSSELHFDPLGVRQQPEF